MTPEDLIVDVPPSRGWTQDRWRVDCPDHGAQSSPRDTRDEAVERAREHIDEAH